MKKIIFILGMFLFFTKAYAFEEGAWTDEVIADSNVSIASSEIRYRWYKNENVFSPDYYIEGENDAVYPNKCENDFIVTDFSDWQEGPPVLKLNGVIESRAARRYRTLRPIRYLFLENVTGGFLTFNIAELNVLIDNQKTQVSMLCRDCSPNFDQDVNDELYSTKAYINNGGSLKIDLGAYYGIEQIRLELYMYDSVPNTKKFNLYFNEGDTLTDRNYASKEIAFYVVSNDINKPERHLIIPDATFIVNPVYTDWIYIDGAVNATYYREMQFLSQYRSKDKKFRYYKVERSYMDGYFSNVADNNYIKDEDSAKTFYLYKSEIREENNNATPAETAASYKPQISIQQAIPSVTEVSHSNKSSNSIATDNKMADNSTTNNVIPLMQASNNLLVKKNDADLKKNDVNNNLNIHVMWSVCSLLIFVLIIILFKLRRHNLSYQK